MKESRKAILMIVLAAALGGGIGVFSKIALHDISPVPYTLIRFILGIATLLPFVFKYRKELKFVNPGRLILISLLGTINITIFIFAIGNTSADIGSMLYAGSPLIVGILSYLILKENITRKKIFGILIGFIGVLLIVFLPTIGRYNPFNGNLFSNLMILIAVCSTSLSAVMIKKFQKDYTTLEFTVAFFAVTIATQLLLIPWDLVQHPAWFTAISSSVLWAILYNGILGTGIYYFLYQYAINKTTPVTAAMILYLSPIFTFLWAWLLLGETLTSTFIAGSVLAFIGVALVTAPEKSVL